MDITISSGTGSGKSTLISKLNIDNYYIDSEFSKTITDGVVIESNIQLFERGLEKLVQLQLGKPFILDRNPIDYLAGSLLLGEISIIEAYQYVDMMERSLERPLSIIITPVQDPAGCYASVIEKKSRIEFWERVFTTKVHTAECNVYLGMTIARNLIILLSNYLASKSDKVMIYQPEPTIPSSYHTWQVNAGKIIESIRKR